MVGINLNPYEHMTYAITFELNFVCFFAVARFIISGSYSLCTSVVDIRGTTTHIMYTDVNGVRIGGSAKHAQIVLMRASMQAQHTQNCNEIFFLNQSISLSVKHELPHLNTIPKTICESSWQFDHSQDRKWIITTHRNRAGDRVQLTTQIDWRYGWGAMETRRFIVKPFLGFIISGGRNSSPIVEYIRFRVSRNILANLINKTNETLYMKNKRRKSFVSLLLEDKVVQWQCCNRPAEKYRHSLSLHWNQRKSQSRRNSALSWSFHASLPLNNRWTMTRATEHCQHFPNAAEYFWCHEEV